MEGKKALELFLGSVTCVRGDPLAPPLGYLRKEQHSGDLGSKCSNKCDQEERGSRHHWDVCKQAGFPAPTPGHHVQGSDGACTGSWGRLVPGESAAFSSQAGEVGAKLIVANQWCTPEASLPKWFQKVSTREGQWGNPQLLGWEETQRGTCPTPNCLPSGSQSHRPNIFSHF